MAKSIQDEKIELVHMTVIAAATDAARAVRTARKALVLSGGMVLLSLSILVVGFFR